MTRPVTLANGKPAWTAAKPRIRQSDIDQRKAWKSAEVREMRMSE